MVRCPACGGNRLLEQFVDKKIVEDKEKVVTHYRCYDCSHVFSHTECNGINNQEQSNS